jgi:hypothetical protein
LSCRVEVRSEERARTGIWYSIADDEKEARGWYSIADDRALLPTTPV